jgi:hypothetical protein
MKSYKCTALLAAGTLGFNLIVVGHKHDSAHAENRCYEEAPNTTRGQLRPDSGSMSSVTFTGTTLLMS